MQLPFNLEDVRLISIEGQTIRLVLPTGHVEISLDSRKPLPRKPAPSPTAGRTNSKHIMFDDGIYGI
jgi:hypothetical protein